MDLNKLSTAEAFDVGSVMQVMHPVTGEPVDGMTITLAGQDSRRYLDAQRAIADRRLTRKDPMTAKDLEAEDLDGLVAVTIAWTGFEWGNEPTECTPTNVRRIYADHGFAWLKRQVNAHVHERKNFLKTSPAA